jgi:uncharacterized repeat protein (TIGR01451 family)
MRSKLFTLIALTAISISFIFGGCGGGGGGGNGATGIQYTGLTTQATIDENNAEQLALGAYTGGDIGTVMGGRAVVQTGEIDRSRTIALVEAIEKSILHIDLNASLDGASYRAIITDSGTILGNCGGSISYTVEINDVTGEFTGTFNFSNYCEDDVTLSGSSSISGIVDLVIGEFIQLSMSFDSLIVTVTGDTFTTKGNISYDDLQAPLVHVDMDLLMRDNSTEKVYWSHNYYLRISKGPDYIELYMIGRYYDPDCGYVDVESTTDFRIYDVDLWPSSGVLIVEGDTGTFGGNTMARLTDYSCGACVVDADTDGGGSYSWSSGFLNMYFEEVDPPQAPYNLEPPNNEILVGTEPTLSWTAGARSCGFDVYLDTVNPPLTRISSKHSETTFQTSGLAASTIYYWKVVAWNAIGSDSSKVQSFKTGVDPTLTDVAVYKTCPVEMIAGEQASYTVTVMNNGPAPALGVIVTDTLPNCVQFVEATSDSAPFPPDAIDDTALTWYLGDIAIGASVEFSIVVQTDEDCPYITVVNDVSATTDSGDDTAGNNNDSCSSEVLVSGTP